MTAAALDRIRRACLAGRPLPPEDAAALARAIETAERDDQSIDAALGLAPGWQRTVRMRKRDAALREIAGIVTGGSKRERARKILGMLTTYAAGEYRIDRRCGSIPAGQRALLFGLLEANGGEVIGFQSIRNFLADGG